MRPTKKQRAIFAKIRDHPTEVTTEDIRNYGDVSKLRIMFDEIGMKYYLISYLAVCGHNFGYESIDDPVSSDPDNILNVLIKAAPTKPSSQNDLSGELHDTFNDYPIPWQVMVRLAQAYRDGELPFINYFDQDELHYYTSQTLYEPTENKMRLVRELIRGFNMPVNKPTYRNNGDRLIHVAVEQGNHEVVKLLLEAGADPNIRGQKGKTACELAVDVKMRNLVCPPILSPNAAPMRQHLGVKSVEALASRQGLTRRLKMLAHYTPKAAAGAGGQGQPDYIGGRRKILRRTKRRNK